MKRSHILLSAGLTLLLILFFVWQQMRLGSLGPGADSALCSDYCLSQGYAASGMPPQISGERTCSCFDAAGREVIRVPLDGLTP